MSDAKIRIGMIGAGAICRDRHLPGLAAIGGVELVAVANRTVASGKKIAGAWGFAHVLDDWQALIRRPDIDAVFVGTWPYMHRQMSVAALEAGKHVFCQARMAMNLDEAKAMVAAARAHPNLVNMICPPPTRMPFEPYVKKLIADGRLGQLCAAELVSDSGANLATDRVTWRERVEFSGRQILALGIFAETLNAWVGPYESLSAVHATPVPHKRDESGKGVAIAIPQVVTITGKLRSGALITERHSGLTADKTTPGNRLTLWGDKGTLRYAFGDTIEFANAGEELQPVNVPQELRRGWRVEEDFISAVRAAMANQPVDAPARRVSPDFAEGLLYMRKVEAVHVSAATGKSVQPAEL